MDIVFVVDNSGSMEQEQDNLAANFPRFIEVLETFDNNLDYRVGVTTTGIDFVWRNVGVGCWIQASMIIGAV